MVLPEREIVVQSTFLFMNHISFSREELVLMLSIILPRKKEEAGTNLN